MEYTKEDKKVVFTLIGLIFFVLVFSACFDMIAKNTGNYTEYTRIETFQIQDKYTREQGKVSKFFYLSDKKKCFMIINGRTYYVSQNLYNKYNIGDEVNIEIKGTKTYNYESDCSFSIDGEFIFYR